jgi:hypothetical protein
MPIHIDGTALDGQGGITVKGARAYWLDINYRGGADRLALMLAARKLLEEEHPVTIRRLYYMLFSNGYIDNSQKTYSGIVIPCMVKARQLGIIKWGWVEDTTRTPDSPQAWDNPADYGKTVKGAYRRDTWPDQEVYVEAWVEKRADFGHVRNVCREYRVPSNAGNGYDGWSSIYEASKRYEAHENAGREVHVVYLGDYDPSGLQMPISLEERLRWFDVSPRFHRIALNWDQVEAHELPEWPGKTTDSRYEWMLREHGRAVQIELDALPLGTMRQAIHDELRSILDMTALEATFTREAEERDRIVDAIGGAFGGDT